MSSGKRKKKPDYTAYEDREQLCPHFEKCGGCTMQKVSYEKQLEIKTAEVMNLLGISDAADESIENNPTVFEGILPSPLQEGYRNKMEFTFGDEFKDGPFALGLHMRGSFMNIVNITDCRLVHNDINIIRNAVRDFFAPLYESDCINFRNNRTGKGYLRHLLIRKAWSTGQILAALVTTSQYHFHDKNPGSGEGSIHDSQPDASACVNDTYGEDRLMADLVNVLTSLQLDGEITGILHIINDSTSDVVKSDRTDVLYGRDYIMEKILGLEFKISPFSFFQTNSSGAEVLYSKVREYACLGDGTLFDLYSGTGTIAQIMSSSVGNVIGVEIVAEAVDAARENAKRNGIANVKFIAEDVLKALDELPTPDYIILDPPREGVNPKALGKILGYDVENIIYVSCKPSSLARDMAAFKLAGYAMTRVCCVDMFPQTGNVETIALMSKKSE